MQKKIKLLLLEGSAAASVGVDVAVIVALARRMARPAGCISSLGFSQLRPLVAALFPQSVKPGGTEGQC